MLHQHQQQQQKSSGSMKSRNWLVVSVILLMFCFSINLCIIVNESSREAFEDIDTTQPDFDLMAGLTKTWFRSQFEGAPTCDPIDPSNITYTLVTQMSMDRFWLASRHCKRWRGPISMAVVTGGKTSDDLLERLKEKDCDTTQIDVEAIQNIHSEYAVNTLRNMALRNVKTSHFVYVDVDFWVSANLYDVLHMDNIRTALAEDSKLALVIPAFELKKHYKCDTIPNCTEEIKDLVMPMTPHQLTDLQAQTVEASENKFVPQITAFDELVNPLGHNSTLYQQWYDQEEGSLFQIPCFQSGKYEPYLVTRYCRDMPPFQEDFTGYGKNKVAWIWHLRRVGYVFKQIGQVFVVHFPHKISKAKRKWIHQTKRYNSFQQQQQNHHRKKSNHNNRMRKLFGSNVGGSKNETATTASAASAKMNSAIATYKRAQMDEVYVRFRNWLSRMKTPVRTPRCEDWINTDEDLWSATPLVERPW